MTAYQWTASYTAILLGSTQRQISRKRPIVGLGRPAWYCAADSLASVRRHGGESMLMHSIRYMQVPIATDRG